MDVEKWLNNYYPVARTITKPTVVELIKRAITQDREEREQRGHPVDVQCPNCNKKMTWCHFRDPLAAKLERLAEANHPSGKTWMPLLMPVYGLDSIHWKIIWIDDFDDEEIIRAEGPIRDTPLAAVDKALEEVEG